MKMITVSDETYQKLQDLGRQMAAKSAKEREQGEIVDALVEGFAQLKALPSQVAELSAAVEASKRLAVEAVAGELAAPPAETPAA